MPAPGRRFVFQVHLWAGLCAGLFLAVMALTGTVLMFRPELDARWNADALTVPPAAGRQPLDVIVDAGQRAHPDGRIDLVRVYSDPDASVQIEFTDNAASFVDPHTAAVVAVGHKYSDFLFWVEQVHRYLALGPAGAWVTGTCAVACAILVLTGLYLWIPPAWRALRQGLRLNRRLTGRAWHFNLHKVLGFYAGAFILFSALTGAPDALDWAKQLEYAATHSAPPRAPKSRPPAGVRPPRATWQSLYGRLQAIAPDAHETVIHNPEGPRDAVASYFVRRGAPQPDARSVVYFDAYSGAVLRYLPYEASSRGYRMYFWGLCLHQGLVGGLAWRLALLGGALTLPLLAYTGGAMYYRRKFRPASRQAVRRPRPLLPCNPPKKIFH